MTGQRPVVLWDLDGTVLDPAGAITEGIAEALWTCGFEAPENLERFVGPPIGESLRRWTEVPEENIPQVVSVYRAGYLTEGLERTRVYPGILPVLQQLREAGVRQAVATQKPEHIATQVVARFDLEQYFETVSGAADDLAPPTGSTGAVHDKPAIIGEALRRLGALPPDPARTVMVGDRSYDAEGARSHGIDCLGAGWGFGGDGELAAGCAAVAATPGDLADLLHQYTDQ
ncbi:HAD hydrolase-like protein [Kocuria sp.]|uniref:HAD hydrolase-like protein n=1 Tax=Kocuria sp. TaxID=1871328 RepID=UPI0026DBAF19|nr:HAD hydrolase-like protein [Kocuria sp.]MDO4919736.1 HAD hydrolase-like protein [Kocuria sp.]